MDTLSHTLWGGGLFGSNPLTGSIGVAIAFPTLENVFDYVGVNFDGVTTSEYAALGQQAGTHGH